MVPWAVAFRLSPLAGATLVALAGAAAPVWPESPSGLEGEFTVEVASRYLWRGLVLTDGTVLQGDATVSLGGWSLGCWGNVDTTAVNERGGERYRLQELDVTLGYQHTLSDAWSLGGGVTRYTFPGTADDATTEVFLTGSWLGPFQPSCAVHRDLDAAQGWYVNGSLGHDLRLAERLGLHLGAGVGWGSGRHNRFYYHDAAGAGAADLLLSATLRWELATGGALAVALQRTWLLDEGRSAVPGDRSAASVGVRWTWSF